MRIGVPKEMKVEEYRVGLTPESVRLLAASEETKDSIAPEAVRKILSEEPKRRNPVVIARAR